ncbi:MAG: hypothetical protein QOJ64_3003 [Acidobacteriota bacterium]|jgi:hypothetical protein|nr:hypothetical protein [Acidobacteriota bacterium]
MITIEPADVQGPMSKVRFRSWRVELSIELTLLPFSRWQRIFGPWTLDIGHWTSDFGQNPAS